MHIFFSPHFDDAVLSCGGTIHKLVQGGQEVQVLNIMAGEPTTIPDTPIVRDVHARWKAGDNPVKARQQEDALAVKRLGADVVNSEWPDCIYRTLVGTNIPCYPTAASIFGEVHPFDKAATLYTWFSSSELKSTSTIYGPLGVGHHVDHQVVRNIGIIFKRERPSLALKFYEEYPYTRDTMATKQALALMRRLAPDIRLELETVELSDVGVQAKVEAIACYKTQISSFWPDLQVMEKEVRDMAMRAGDGVPAERYWRAISNESQ
jgi:LmbE family N-acetylglucosaminyl deacetylase